MFIYLRLTLDATPDAAWEALGSPTVFRNVAAPMMRVVSKEKGGFPTRWVEGEPHTVSVRVWGVIPMGTQVIRIEYTERPGGVRMVIDRGAGRSGLLGLMPKWDHRMAVSATEDGKTLYRDRLAVRAGLLTPFAWIALWVVWQARGERLKRLARDWKAPGTGQVPHTD